MNGKLKGFAAIYVVLILLLLSAAGYFVLRSNFSTNNQTGEVKPSPQASPSSSTPTPMKNEDIPRDWKTYTSQKYNFEFEYPQTWFIDEISQPKTTYIALDPEKTQLIESVDQGLPVIAGTVRVYVTDNKTLANIAGINDLKQTNIGFENLINARVMEENFSDNAPIAALTGKYSLIYYFDHADNTYYINFVSSASKENKEVFDRILSTFKFY